MSADAVRFLHSMAQAISTMALYRDGHPSRERTINGSFDLLRRRAEERKHRYMPASLLQSQFETLEPPEEAVRIDVAEPLERSVEKIRAALQT